MKGKRIAFVSVLVGLTLAGAAGGAAWRVRTPTAAVGIEAPGQRGNSGASWSALAAANHSSGAYTFGALDEMYPGSGRRVSRPAPEAIIEGIVVAVEPGLGYGNLIGDKAPVLAYDDPAATTRWADLVVQVDRVLAGELNGESPPGHARVTYLQPQPMSLDELRSALVTKQSVIFFVSNKGEFYQESGLPFQSSEEEEYFRSVQTLCGDLAFVNVMGAATAPLVPPELASRLLSPIVKDDGGAPSYKELVAYIEGGT